MNIEKKAAQKLTHDEVLAAAPKEVSLVQELKALVQAAQQGQQEAIDKLCDKFKGLVKKEAHLSYVQDALGEDAENTAWEIFLEFIQQYKGRRYLVLPGLAKSYLHGKLLNKILRQYSVNSVASLDNEGDAYQHNFPDNQDAIALLETRVGLETALATLSPQQREIIIDNFYHDLSLKECAQRLGCSAQSCYVHKQRAMQKLKQFLNK